MSCCGKKRQAISSWPSGSSTETDERESEGSILSVESNGSRETTVFRYTGSSSVEVDGIFGRRVYKFSKGMPELVIMAEDVALMRGYPELIELKRLKKMDE